MIVPYAVIFNELAAHHGNCLSTGQRHFCKEIRTLLDLLNASSNITFIEGTSNESLEHLAAYSLLHSSPQAYLYSKMIY